MNPLWSFFDWVLALIPKLPEMAIGALVGSLLGVVGGMWRGRRPARSLWPFRDFKDLSIVVALTERKRLPGYVRPQTGLGEVQAIGLLVPSLERASKRVGVPLVGIAMPGDRALRGNLVSVGGPKFNVLTKNLLNDLEEDTHINQGAADIWWKGKEFRGKYREEEGPDGELVRTDILEYDHGIVIRAKNPYDPRQTAIVFSGSHTYGLVGAAEWYVQAVHDRGSLPRSGKNFAALIQCPVPGESTGVPTLVKLMELPRPKTRLESWLEAVRGRFVRRRPVELVDEDG